MQPSPFNWGVEPSAGIFIRCCTRCPIAKKADPFTSNIQCNLQTASGNLASSPSCCRMGLPAGGLASRLLIFSAWSPEETQVGVPTVTILLLNKYQHWRDAEEISTVLLPNRIGPSINETYLMVQRIRMLPDRSWDFKTGDKLEEWCYKLVFLCSL